jgi:hypothetical protein
MPQTPQEHSESRIGHVWRESDHEAICHHIAEIDRTAIEVMRQSLGWVDCQAHVTVNHPGMRQFEYDLPPKPKYRTPAEIAKQYGLRPPTLEQQQESIDQEIGGSASMINPE